MRWLKLLVLLWLLPAAAALAESAQIVKVLPFYLDQKGHHALRPSLYERDAYQAHLRKHAALRSALRFVVRWKASGLEGLTLRVEMRGSKDGQPQRAKIEAPVENKGLFGRWTSATLEGEAYKALGDLTAWRATLWSGDQQVAEQKSYLW
jgi:hypothetical protein